jgi:hypothetical protein
MSATLVEEDTRAHRNERSFPMSRQFLRQRLPVTRRQVFMSSTVLALLGATACAGRRAPAATWTPRPYRLYQGDTPTPKRLLPLDPLTLADLPAVPSIPLDAPLGAFSADGSTLAEIADAPNSAASTIIVRRGPALAEVARFPPPALVGDVRLSRDGNTLVFQHQQQIAGGHLQPDIWYVLDAASGRLRTTVRAAEANAWSVWWIDPAATRLYQPVVTLSMADSAPKPLRLVVYDLTSGAVAGRLTLPHVLAGSWRPGTVVNGDPVVQQQYPALALTAAGGALAVYQPDPAALTVIDAATLTVQRTLARTVADAVLAAVLGALPFFPHRAEAKAVTGTNLRALAAPDGRSLYVWGEVNRLASDGSPVYGSFGLKRIDLARGTVAAQALPDARLFSVVVTPDGRSLYTYEAATAATLSLGESDWPALLRRVDASTLATTAQRRFTGLHTIRVRPV